MEKERQRNLERVQEKNVVIMSFALLYPANSLYNGTLLFC
jgi:hypothetical protein